MAKLFERMRTQMTADDASTMENLMHHLKKEMLAAQEKAAAAEARAEAAEGKVAAAEARAEAAEAKAAVADKRATDILEASKESTASLHEAWLKGGRKLLSQRNDKDAAGDVFRVNQPPREEWTAYQKRMRMNEDGK